LLAALSLLVVGAGCSSSADRTVMVVTVSSDLGVGSELDKVEIVVANGELSYPFTLGSGAGRFLLPVRVALVPGGAKDQQFRVQAVGSLAGDSIVTQSASVSFVSGTAQQLSLFLARSCVRFPMCNEGDTCQNGACVPETTAGTRGTYTGDAGAGTGDGGSGGGLGAGGASGTGGAIGGGGASGIGGSSGIGGQVGTGGTPGIGGGGGGTGGILGVGGSGAGGIIGIGGAGAGTGIGGSGTGGIVGIGGAGAGTGIGGADAGTGIGGAGAGTGSGGAGAGTGSGGFMVTGLGGAGGTFGLGGAGGKLPGVGGGIINPGLGGSAALPTGLTLFQDDFESGFADAWSPTDPGAWQVVAGSGADATSVYQHDGAFTPGNVSIAGDPSWDDVVVEARINVGAFSDSSPSSLGGICARVSLPGDYYLLALRADGYADLRRVSSYAETILTTTSAPVIAASTWYTVRLSAVGSTLNAYLNGALILTAADATYPTGEIGLQTDGATAQFDDVVVTTP
jgi:hypothetical protein